MEVETWRILRLVVPYLWNACKPNLFPSISLFSLCRYLSPNGYPYFLLNSMICDVLVSSCCVRFGSGIWPSPVTSTSRAMKWAHCRYGDHASSTRDTHPRRFVSDVRTMVWSLDGLTMTWKWVSGGIQGSGRIGSWVQSDSLDLCDVAVPAAVRPMGIAVTRFQRGLCSSDIRKRLRQCWNVKWLSP